jgi:hypothetical protein
LWMVECYIAEFDRKAAKNAIIYPSQRTPTVRLNRVVTTPLFRYSRNESSTPARRAIFATIRFAVNVVAVASVSHAGGL